MTDQMMYAASDVFHKYNIQSAHLWQNEVFVGRNDKMAELTDTKVGDYFVPNLTAEPLPPHNLDKYGRMRLPYLQNYKSERYAALLMEGKLFAHLLDIEDMANNWLDRMMPDMTKAMGATEELKACNKIAWVWLMNNCKARVIFAELIMVYIEMRGLSPHFY